MAPMSRIRRQTRTGKDGGRNAKEQFPSREVLQSFPIPRSARSARATHVYF